MIKSTNLKLNAQKLSLPQWRQLSQSNQSMHLLLPTNNTKRYKLLCNTTLNKKLPRMLKYLNVHKSYKLSYIAYKKTKVEKTLPLRLKLRLLNIPTLYMHNAHNNLIIRKCLKLPKNKAKQKKSRKKNLHALYIFKSTKTKKKLPKNLKKFKISNLNANKIRIKKRSIGFKQNIQKLKNSKLSFKETYKKSYENRK